jgi:hypothetical protein
MLPRPSACVSGVRRFLGHPRRRKRCSPQSIAKEMTLAKYGSTRDEVPVSTGLTACRRGLACSASMSLLESMLRPWLCTYFPPLE